MVPEIDQPGAAPELSGKRATAALLLGIILLAAFLAFRFAVNAPPLHPDESDIIFGPGFRAAGGLPSSAGVYPGFPHMFYSFWVRAFSPLLPNEPVIAAWVISRAVNIVLYGINIAIFFLAARCFLGRLTSLFAALVFALSPGVFFSGVYVKTEGLLLFAICLSLWGGARLSKEPGNAFLHALLGCLAGLGVAVKFNPFPALIYAGALWAGRDGFDFLRVRAKIGLFALAFLASVSLMWPGIFDLSRYSVLRFKAAIYFADAPSAFRSVDELFAFPFGRYSYGLCLVLPFSAGPLNCLAALAGLALKSVPKRMLVIWGIFFACYLLFIMTVTLIRPAWMFTPIIPVVAAASGLFVDKLRRGFGTAGKAAAAGAALALVLVSFYQYPAAAMGVDGTVKALFDGTREARRLLGPDRGRLRDNMLVLTNSGLAVQQHYQARRPSAAIIEKHPEFILLLDSYAINFCKYRKNPLFASQCAFFKRLVAGGGGYRVVWSREVDFPWKFVSFDPETSFTVYLLRRNNDSGGAGDTPKAA